MRANKEDFERALSEIVEQLKRRGAKKIILFGSLMKGKVRAGSDIALSAYSERRESIV